MLPIRGRCRCLERSAQPLAVEEAIRMPREISVYKISFVFSLVS